MVPASLGRDRRSPRGAVVSGVGESFTLRHQNDTPIGGQCHFLTLFADVCPIPGFVFPGRSPTGHLLYRQPCSYHRTHVRTVR